MSLHGILRLLRPRGLVLGRRGEDLPAVRERDTAARGVVRTVPRSKALDDDHVANLEGVARNATTLQDAGRAAGESPVGDLAAVVLYVDVEPDVGIHPLDLRDHA